MEAEDHKGEGLKHLFQYWNQILLAGFFNAANDFKRGTAST